MHQFVVRHLFTVSSSPLPAMLSLPLPINIVCLHLTLALFPWSFAHVSPSQGDVPLTSASICSITEQGSQMEVQFPGSEHESVLIDLQGFFQKSVLSNQIQSK